MTKYFCFSNNKNDKPEKKYPIQNKEKFSRFPYQVLTRDGSWWYIEKQDTLMYTFRRS